MIFTEEDTKYAEEMFLGTQSNPNVYPVLKPIADVVIAMIIQARCDARKEIALDILEKLNYTLPNVEEQAK